MNTVCSTFEQLVQYVRMHKIPIYTDSRAVTEGSIFIAQQGTKEDGRAFIYHATTNGAQYIIVEGTYVLPDSSVMLFCVHDIHKAEAELAKALYAVEKYHPNIIGITGTNGKTTSTFLLEHFFTHLHKKVGVLGTVNYRFPNHVIEAPLTTPSCLQIQHLFGAMKHENVDTVIMEVSSHSLQQRRTEGLSFSGAIFTNLTQDHLDYHKTMDEYFEAKALLFSRNPHAKMSINADDPYGKILLERYPKAIGYSLNSINYGHNTILHGKIESMTTQGLRLRLSYEGIEWTFSSPLVGKFNAYNLLGVFALALAYGYTHTELASLENCVGVIGRLERIANSSCFVDYAHTPDALINVLQTLKDTGFSRIITIFGCGGERDTAKRPLMREAVEKYSDIFIITSDNPRSESPSDIVKDILQGVPKTSTYYVEEDRKKAIQLGFSLCKEGDALLIAGKGHEEYQIIGTTKYPFSDQAIIRECLSSHK